LLYLIECDGEALTRRPRPTIGCHAMGEWGNDTVTTILIRKSYQTGYYVP